MTDDIHLLAVDGNSMAHRAWHAITGSDDEVGEFVVAGVLGLVSSVWQHGPYDALVIAFDHERNLRREQHPGYKAGRSTDPDLQERLATLDDRLARLGVATVREEGLEADDLLAGIVDEACGRGWRVDVLSGDRDLTALVCPTVRLLRPRGTMADLVVTTPEVVQASYGVRADQYRDFAAMRGDPSDGLAGVHGIGAKSAAALLADFGTLTEVYANLPYMPTKIERALRAGRDNADHNLLVMHPLPVSTPLGPVLDSGLRIDLDAVVTVLEDLGADDPGLARTARRLTWAGNRSTSPLPSDVPLPQDAPPPDEVLDDWADDDLHVPDFDDDWARLGTPVTAADADDAAALDPDPTTSGWPDEGIVVEPAVQDSLF